ncbi:MAG: cell division protein SepF [Solobacterium sp.]|nr:cell division protein SepF [Solobacterium sp.]
MGLKDKVMGFIAPEVEDDDDAEEVVEAPEPRNISRYEEKQNANIKSQVAADTKMVLFEPRTFEEAEEIAMHLKQRRAAVVNLHRLQRDYAQRTIDFLAGAVFALDGKIQKIGHNVILCSPKSIGVDGEISLESGDE